MYFSHNQEVFHQSVRRQFGQLETAHSTRGNRTSQNQFLQKLLFVEVEAKNFEIYLLHNKYILCDKFTVNSDWKKNSQILARWTI